MSVLKVVKRQVGWNLSVSCPRLSYLSKTAPKIIILLYNEWHAKPYQR